MKNNVSQLIARYQQVADIVENDSPGPRRQKCLALLSHFDDNVFSSGSMSFGKVIQDIMFEFDFSDPNFKRLQRLYNQNVINDFLKRVSVSFDQKEKLAIDLGCFFNLFDDCCNRIISSLNNQKLLGNDHFLLPDLMKILASVGPSGSGYTAVMNFLEGERQRGVIFSHDNYTDFDWAEYSHYIYFRAVLEVEKNKAVSYQSDEVYYVQLAKAELQRVLGEMVTALTYAQNHLIKSVTYYTNMVTGVGGFTPFYVALKEQERRLKAARSSSSISHSLAGITHESASVTAPVPMSVLSVFSSFFPKFNSATADAAGATAEAPICKEGCS